MSAELHKRADEIRAGYKAKESHKGTGYHDEDRNPTRPDLFLCPQRNGLSRASESLVHFTDHDGEEQHFVGPDAEKALAALKAWHVKNLPGDPLTKPGAAVKLLRLIPALKVEQVEGAPRLTIPLRVWNDVLFALHAEGVGLLGAPLTQGA